jgi:hypothetical protein
MNRRNWLKTAAGLLVAAPMVVRAENIMRVQARPLPRLAGEWRDGDVFYNIPDDRMYMIRIDWLGRKSYTPCPPGYYARRKLNRD